jgi:hypothetical protein
VGTPNDPCWILRKAVENTTLKKLAGKEIKQPNCSTAVNKIIQAGTLVKSSIKMYVFM